MGLDLALGAVILIAAIRGWLRGFVGQAIRIAGFVACFYLASPVRDQARPYVLERLPKVDPALMDRILWWTSAAAAYVVIVGTTTLLVRLARRPDPSGKAEARRDDRFAGLILGAGKGALVAVFLLAAFQKYAGELRDRIGWVGDMADGSKALEWNREYDPAPKIWESVPVRRFVDHIRRNGLSKPTEGPVASEADGQVAEARDPESPRPIPRLELPEPPAATDFDPEILADLERFKAERDARRDRGPEPDWR
ncbi:CvpA family protein [Paludisphaera sp.]|uniref:CvpA family protein n=1 Tax=Paludisphaera sp. TaxID=2017432 RepID=UPI00301BFABE